MFPLDHGDSYDLNDNSSKSQNEQNLYPILK